MCFIKLKEATKAYLNIKFDLEINKGELIVITGTNGTGKSTLIKLIIGYIKPDSGSIIKNTKRIAYLSEHQVMPEFLNSLNYLKELKRMKKGSYDYLLYNNFNIPNKTIKELSKGNRQKLAIVGCLIGNNDLYVFDEPLSGLDKESVNIFKRKIISMQQMGQSIIIATHNKNIFNRIPHTHIEL